VVMQRPSTLEPNGGLRDPGRRGVCRMRGHDCGLPRGNDCIPQPGWYRRRARRGWGVVSLGGSLAACFSSRGGTKLFLQSGDQRREHRIGCQDSLFGLCMRAVATTPPTRSKQPSSSINSYRLWSRNFRCDPDPGPQFDNTALSSASGGPLCSYGEPQKTNHHEGKSKGSTQSHHPKPIMRTLLAGDERSPLSPSRGS